VGRACVGTKGSPVIAQECGKALSPAATTEGALMGPAAQCNAAKSNSKRWGGPGSSQRAPRPVPRPTQRESAPHLPLAGGVWQGNNAGEQGDQDEQGGQSRNPRGWAIAKPSRVGTSYFELHEF